MKKRFILAALAVVAAVACQKTEAPELSVSSNTLTIASEGETVQVDVISNQDWTVSASESWITLGSAEGTGSVSLSVSIAPFTEAAARSGQITIVAGSLQQVIAVVQSAPVAPAEPSKNSFKAIALGGAFEVEVPEGYTYTVSSSADWITTEPSENGITVTVAPYVGATEKRSGKVEVLFGSSVLAEATIEQSYRNVEPGELLIEEIYFTGSPIEGSTNSSDDQYIKLTNNSDHTIYADRVMFVTSFITGTVTSVGAYYEYPALEDGLAVENMYVIPGDGDDHPVAPGESLILALAALDYTNSYVSDEETVEGNTQAIDLSKADFEFYDENEYWPDTDNPDVQNLEIWFKASATITMLHKRGFESYAICLPPYGETAESILENRHWTGTFTFYFNEFVIPRQLDTQDVWVIPGEWVLDAVNCSLADSFYQNPWPAAFDAGWTFCGEYDGDPARMGRSVRRSLDARGKLVDSNNSTNDFTPNATPSLK